jgi:2-haloacid dehalogenase
MPIPVGVALPTPRPFGAFSAIAGDETMQLPKVITFDCYDTLVEFPIDDVARAILGSRAEGIDLDSLLADFEKLRYETTTHAPYQPYREVLRGTLRQIMEQYGIPYREEDGDKLLAAVRTWGPYPDVPPALERLRQHCQLAIITNSDDDIMAENVRRIGVPIDFVITAEQAGAYKPSLETFAYALAQIGCAPEEILHVAQGFEYDIVPAHALGWNRVWINRYGKTGDPAYGPYHELPNLSGLPDLLGI